VIGFSAGGHMVAATSTHFEKRSYPAADAADKESCRPDFAIALYPGHLWRASAGLKLNPNVPVTTNTPPTFLLHAEDDKVDDVKHSLVYYMALKGAAVPVEMHLLRKVAMRLDYDHRTFQLPVGLNWWKLVEDDQDNLKLNESIANIQLHANPARAPRFMPGVAQRQVGELTRSTK
jgi:acetyl esterase/lipase